MSTPKVSVLVTVYNRERFLEETLSSILDSTYKDYEVIVVDDCSSDRSFEIADQAAENSDRIKVVRNEKNLGDYPNRMKAASLACGRYIKYVDSDDLLYPHSLAVMVESMEKSPGVALGLSHSLSEDDSPYPWLLSPEDVYRKHFLGRGCLSCGPSGAIIRRDAFELIGGFRPQWKVLSDTDLWYRMAARWPVLLLPPAMVWWRRHEEQEYSKNDAAAVYLKCGYELNMQTLSDSNCPLSENDRTSAIERTRQHFARKLLSTALYEQRWASAVSAFRGSDLTIVDLARSGRISKLASSPKISVVIPAFNAEAFVAESVNSVLGQTIEDFEVIVVDDGSIDLTAGKVRQFTDPRVRLIEQSNKGQSAAINCGVEHSQGAYIKLMDADDWINPEHLESQLSLVEKKQDVLASCAWGYFIDDCANPLVRNEYTNRNYDNSLEWLVDSLTRDEGMMGGWMWLIPRTLWNKAGGFDPRLSLNNDFHFSIKLLLASEGIRYAQDAVYSYRKGVSGALSSCSDSKAMKSAFLTTELGVRLLLEREDSPRIRKICADRFQQWLFQFYPGHTDLVSRTEDWIKNLGGSELEMKGGRLFRLIEPVIGWKRTRLLQEFSYRYGWGLVLRTKARSRLARISRA